MLSICSPSVIPLTVTQWAHEVKSRKTASLLSARRAEANRSPRDASPRHQAIVAKRGGSGAKSLGTENQQARGLNKSKPIFSA